MKMKAEQIDKAIALLTRAQQSNPTSVPEISDFKLRNFMEDHLQDPKTLMIVNKDVSAILIMMVGRDYFSTRQSINDLAFYSETTGSGFRLLKEAKVWVEAWGDSVHAAYFTTTLARDDVDKMIERTGLEKIGTQFKFKLGDVS